MSFSHSMSLHHILSRSHAHPETKHIYFSHSTCAFDGHRKVYSPCLVQRHVLHPRLHVELWMEERAAGGGSHHIMGVIEHASFSFFTLALYLPLSLQLFASGGNYSSLYRPLHPTFSLSVFLKQNSLSIAVLSLSHLTLSI